MIVWLANERAVAWLEHDGDLLVSESLKCDPDDHPNAHPSSYLTIGGHSVSRADVKTIISHMQGWIDHGRLFDGAYDG